MSPSFALEDLPCAAALVRDGMLTVNGRLEALIGLTQAELETLDGWFPTVFGARADAERQRYESARDVWFVVPLELEIETPHDGRVYVEQRVSPVDGGELWLLTDITDQFREKERFRVLFENSSDAQMLFDETGIVDCNRAAVAMLRCESKEALLQLTPGELSHERQTEMVAVARENGKHRFDWVQRRMDGEDLPVEVTLTSTDLAGRPVLLVEWHEISERLKAEEAIRAARDEARRAAKAKAEFLATMSHEIRTPLNAVIGMTSILRRTSLSAEQYEYVETVHSAGTALCAIIDDILSFSKLEADKVTLEAVPLSVRGLVDETLAMMAERAHSAGLELVARVAPDVPDEVVGDPVRLRQILINLVGNAIKFTADGEVEVTVEFRADGRLRFAVRDTGVGIAEEALGRLFSAFTQADTSTTRHFGGTGLGLVISRRLARLMGGDITVESELGRGSVFRVDVALPAGTPPSVLAPRERRALVVVPSAAARRQLEAQLVDIGVEVVAVADAEAAAVAFEERAASFDDLFVDALVPPEDAARLVAMARVDTTRAIALRHIGAPAAEGFDGTLRKPIRTRDFAAVLEAAGGSSKAAAVTSDVAVFAMNVLVVDDNVVNQRVAGAMLGRLGCRVDFADDGAAAIEIAQNGDYDLVLMDCQMPGMDSFEATRRLRKRGLTTPILALTASVLDRDRSGWVEAGMDDYLTKPITVAALANALKRWVSRSPSTTNAKRPADA